MNEDIFAYEEKKLKEVISLIQEKITIAEENFKKQENFKIGFKEGQRGTQFNRQALMSMYATEVSRLKSVLNNPYFGRFEFKSKDTGEFNLIYIGKKSITSSDNESICYDWRSPICSLYYDYSIGPCEYDFNNQKYKGDILSKRQIIIKDGILKKVAEEDVLSDDNILVEYLEENLDARLKSIIATIQKEQNQIIRRPLMEHNIIEGVAGSGKTTVALHRIAYLLYNNERNIKDEEFMIIGPNKYFLNFIADLLPDLDIKNVCEYTFEEIATSLIGNVRFTSRNVTLENVLNNKSDLNIIKYKNSLEFLHLLENYIENYVIHHLQKDITYEGLTLVNKEKLQIIYNKFLNTSLSYNEKVSIFIKNLTKEIKDNADDLIHDLWLRYRDEYLSLPKDSERRKEILAYHDRMSQEIKKGCPNTLKEYFSFLKIKPLTLYEEFINNLNNQELKEEINSNLNGKKVSYDDLAPLALISFLLNGSGKFKNYQHLVIDEGQDLSLAQYYVLKKIFPKSYFDVFGDINQSIYDYTSIKNWKVLNDLVFNQEANLLVLNKSYRITTEISDLANEVLKELGYMEALCIARSKEEIKINEITKNNSIPTLIMEIKHLLDKDYLTIAIITKDLKSGKDIYTKLQKYGLDIALITEQNTEYKGGLCIVPSYLAKGLEFDAVIIANGNDVTYGLSNIDLKLLYVAITRAMHEVYINYEGSLSLPLQNYVNKNTLKRTLRKKN